MVSLSISASSSHADPMSAPPSVRYQASIYSTHSYNHPYRYGHRSSRNTSLEQLVPKKRVRFDNKSLPVERTQKSKGRMSSNGSETGGVTIERKMSYGIGGAGNISRSSCCNSDELGILGLTFHLAGRPSDVIYPVRLNADGTRRRPSVWSSITVSPGTSPDGKRSGIMSLFRRSNAPGDASNGAVERDLDENAAERA
jgi:hypothetical protein